MNQTNKSKIRCDNCGESNDDKSIYCKKCHAMLFRNIKCEKCGAENRAKNIYCDKCNHQLQPDPNIEKAKENNKNNFKIGVVALAIVACALIAFFIFLPQCSFDGNRKPDDLSDEAYDIVESILIDVDFYEEGSFSASQTYNSVKSEIEKLKALDEHGKTNTALTIQLMYLTKYLDQDKPELVKSQAEIIAETIGKK